MDFLLRPGMPQLFRRARIYEVLRLFHQAYGHDSRQSTSSVGQRSPLPDCRSAFSPLELASPQHWHTKEFYPRLTLTQMLFLKSFNRFMSLLIRVLFCQLPMQERICYLQKSWDRLLGD